MPELRKDPIVGRWVILATNRVTQPDSDRETKALSEDDEFCPFCEGNEDSTPTEILAYREPDSTANCKGWRVRALANKCPSLQIEGELDKRADGIYDVMNGVGAHEVIIECPQHETNMSHLSLDNIREVFWMYRDRLVDLKKDRRLVHALIFKNVGRSAGALLDHSHSQLIATPVIPVSIAEEMAGASDFFHYRNRCIYCDIVQQELAADKRVVSDTPEFLVFCPFASRFPFEMWVVPKRHSSHFENIPHHGIEELGLVMKTILGKLEFALDDPAYNYILHTAPFDSNELQHYHWHIEIFPRLNRVAGFEWGSGFYINPVLPEKAAQFLRDVEVDSHMANGR